MNKLNKIKYYAILILFIVSSKLINNILSHVFIHFNLANDLKKILTLVHQINLSSSNNLIFYLNFYLFDFLSKGVKHP